MSHPTMAIFRDAPFALLVEKAGEIEGLPAIRAMHEVVYEGRQIWSMPLPKFEKDCIYIPAGFWIERRPSVVLLCNWARFNSFVLEGELRHYLREAICGIAELYGFAEWLITAQNAVLYSALGRVVDSEYEQIEDWLMNYGGPQLDIDKIYSCEEERELCDLARKRYVELNCAGASEYGFFRDSIPLRNG